MVQYEFPDLAGQNVTITRGVTTLTIENGMAWVNPGDPEMMEMVKKLGGKMIIHEITDLPRKSERAGK